ncbi:MAG: hypothetical protein LQ341_005312, partial [Variospora aurantia]
HGNGVFEQDSSGQQSECAMYWRMTFKKTSMIYSLDGRQAPLVNKAHREHRNYATVHKPGPYS